MIIHRGLVRFPVLMLILFAACSLAVLRPVAAQSPKDSRQRIRVLGHVDLPGMHVNQMFLQQQGEKYFLYLHRPTKQAFALVDISKPEKPVLAERAALQDRPGARTELVKSDGELALSVAPESPADAGPVSRPPGPAPAVSLPTETVTLIDIANPKSPKTILTFSGVTSLLPDEQRRLLYIVNQEGLWIVVHRELQPMVYCDSSAAIMIQPHCQ